MNFTSIFLLTMFFLVLLFVGLIKILDTSTARIFLINWKARQDEKERIKELEKFKQRTYEQAKNPDHFLELILKMRMGEEVKIPLAAFSYIYKNLERFTIFDKEGNITIINQEDYFKFKNKAIKLIEQNQEKDVQIEKIIEQEKEKVVRNPIEIIEHEDGTFIKKDYVAKTIEIKKPNDEKTIDLFPPKVQNFYLV